MPSREPRTLSHNPETLPQQLRSHFDSPVAYCGVSAGSEAANKRRITLQVRDRLERPWKRRWVVTVFLATADNGAPDNTDNAVLWQTGDVLATFLVDGGWIVLTDANGMATFDLTITGAATRVVATVIDCGLVDYSSPITWI